MDNKTELIDCIDIINMRLICILKSITQNNLNEREKIILQNFALELAYNIKTEVFNFTQM